MKTNLHNKFYCIQSKQFFFDLPRIETKFRKKIPFEIPSNESP